LINVKRVEAKESTIDYAAVKKAELPRASTTRIVNDRPMKASFPSTKSINLELIPNGKALEY